MLESFGARLSNWMVIDEVQTHSSHRQQYFFQATPMLGVFIVLVCNFHNFETRAFGRCYNIASFADLN
jgi:hypothetical protein